MPSGPSATRGISTLPNRALRRRLLGSAGNGGRADMEPWVNCLGRRDLKLPWVIFAMGFAVSLFPGSDEAIAQSLPGTITGKAQVYDGVTLDLMQDGERFSTAARIRLEAVDACELRQKARQCRCRLAVRRSGNREVSISHVGQGGRMSAVACPLRGGGYRAQCYVDGTDIAAAGLGQGMYVLAVPDKNIHRSAIPRLRPQG